MFFRKSNNKNHQLENLSINLVVELLSKQTDKKLPMLKSEKGLIILAFAIIYIVWGSTYLANEYAIDSIPPWIMAMGRFLAAGVLLFVFTLVQKVPLPTWAQVKNTWLLGVLFMTIGIGATVWAQKYVDSGFTALLISANPLVVVLMLWALNGKRPKWRSMVGVFLGIVGMGLLVGGVEIEITEDYLWGVFAIIASTFAWAYGAISIPKLDLPESKMQSAALQMLLGGMTLFPISVFNGDWETFTFSQVTEESIEAWIYLVLFGSIAAFTAFNYLLTKVSAEKVSTNTYVNPVIALALGWWLRDELLTPQMLIAGFVMLLGVFFINSSKN